MNTNSINANVDSLKTEAQMKMTALKIWYSVFKVVFFSYEQNFTYSCHDLLIDFVFRFSPINFVNLVTE